MKNNNECVRKLEKFCTGIKSNFVTEFVTRRRKFYKGMIERQEELEANEGGWLDVTGEYRCDFCGCIKSTHENGADVFYGRECTQQMMEDPNCRKEPRISNEFIFATAEYSGLHKERTTDVEENGYYETQSFVHDYPYDYFDF